ncbi:hypothetical protein DV515_00011993 [Chloebia gouldiae]|uniref:Uncharacterized protein n=1 Tax=Chloebia gouldiae TaxID=44316 RepID=A0A3L8S6F0_CHLGU|nr:hypothetical protein DV515_00011993 [Chloebia gouldiae]
MSARSSSSSSSSSSFPSSFPPAPGLSGRSPGPGRKGWNSLPRDPRPQRRWIPSITAPAHGDAVSLLRASPASSLRSFPPSKMQFLPLLVPPKSPSGAAWAGGDSPCDSHTPGALCLESRFVERSVCRAAFPSPWKSPCSSSSGLCHS